MRSLAARALLTLILAVLLVGFGVCGAYGTFYGMGIAFSLSPFSQGYWPSVLFIVGCGVAGLIIAWICLRSIVRLWRARAAPVSRPGE